MLRHALSADPSSQNYNVLNNFIRGRRDGSVSSGREGEGHHRKSSAMEEKNKRTNEKRKKKRNNEENSIKKGERSFASTEDILSTARRFVCASDCYYYAYYTSYISFTYY